MPHSMTEVMMPICSSLSAQPGLPARQGVEGQQAEDHEQQRDDLQERDPVRQDSRIAQGVPRREEVGLVHGVDHPPRQ